MIRTNAKGTASYKEENEILKKAMARFAISDTEFIKFIDI